MDSNHTCLAVISLDYALKKDENFHPQGFLEEFAKLLGLRGNVGCVGAWVAWVKFLCGLRGLRESKYFLRGSTFYVGHNFYVGCVGQICFCVGQFFLWCV